MHGDLERADVPEVFEGGDAVSQPIGAHTLGEVSRGIASCLESGDREAACDVIDAFLAEVWEVPEEELYSKLWKDIRGIMIALYREGRTLSAAPKEKLQHYEKLP